MNALPISAGESCFPVPNDKTTRLWVGIMLHSRSSEAPSAPRVGDNEPEIPLYEGDLEKDAWALMRGGLAAEITGGLSYPNEDRRTGLGNRRNSLQRRQQAPRSRQLHE